MSIYQLLASTEVGHKADTASKAHSFVNLSSNEYGIWPRKLYFCRVGGDLSAKKDLRTNILKSFRTQVIFKRIFATRKFLLVGSIIKKVT